MTQPSQQPRSRRTLWIILGSVAGVLILCCAGALIIGAIVGPQKTTRTAAAPTTPAAATHTAAAPTTPPAATTRPPSQAPKTTSPPADPDRRICSFTDNGGTYYLYVTSATAHNFTVCAGGTPYPGQLDDLFAMQGMDRRCILGPDATARYEAIIGVYSSARSADLKAARAYCSSNGGTDNG